MTDKTKTFAPSSNTLQRAVLWLARQDDGPDLDKAYTLAAVLFGKARAEIVQRVENTRGLLQ